MQRFRLPMEMWGVCLVYKDIFKEIVTFMEYKNVFLCSEMSLRTNEAAQPWYNYLSNTFHSMHFFYILQGPALFFFSVATQH